MWNSIKENFKPALVIFATLSFLTGILYPLLITGTAGVIFPDHSGGSLIWRGSVVVGSRLIGQDFQDPGYFWGRLSATVPPYNAFASGGSNLGLSNPAWIERVRQRAATLRAADPRGAAGVPADLVTASGSGLDPDISPAAAFYQVPRVARARHLDEARVKELVGRRVKTRQFWILGEPRVNVLELNLALDRMAGPRHPNLASAVRIDPAPAASSLN